MYLIFPYTNFILFYHFIRYLFIYLSGWIVGFMAINKNNVVAVILIVIGFFWTVNALLSLYLIKQVHTLYKGTGATVQDAQREAVIAAASNKTIRDGAKDAILRNAV